MNPVENSLQNAFSRHRIVVWYDPAREWQDDFQGLALDEVEKVTVNNTEFAAKYRILIHEPKRKFLLYIPSAKPRDEENWLLDVVLANYEFRSDKISLYMQEIGLPPEFKDLADEHQPFFARAERREQLKQRFQKDDDGRTVLRRMMAVCVGSSDDALESILLEFCHRIADSDLVDPVDEMLFPSRLQQALWQELERTFNYRSNQPTLLDFVIEVFRKNAPLDQPSRLNVQAVVFLSRWKDSDRYHESFRTLSARVGAMLNISHHLNQLAAIDTLLDLDAYELIEMRLVHHLRTGLVEGTLKAEAVAALVKRRERSPWFDDYTDLYKALKHAGRLFDLVETFDLRFDSFDDGLRRYTEHWWRADYHYRKFHQFRQAANQQGLLDPVEKRAEGYYVNRFLLPLANYWQEKVDAVPVWSSDILPAQTKFFERLVRPYVTAGQKVFVVISDALRYECAAELQRRIEREDRFKSELKAQLAPLPSVTQLGMAALLPHKTLSLSLDGISAFADGKPTAGTEARNKILESAQNIRACAIQAQEFMSLNTKTEGRVLSRDHDVVFIYHNEIDATGDDVKTEGNVFPAVKVALDTLVALLKKVANVNITNMIVTADHGFIFQQSEVDDSDCLPPLPPHPTVSTTRRYVVGPVVAEVACLRIFKGTDAGLTGDIAIGLVKALGRLPIKGSGKRYVHGGASLQEVVVPVLEVRKTRESDVEQVEVEVQSLPSRITTGQLAIRLYQVQPVAGKVLERTLRVGIYTEDGTLISESKALKFDSAHEEPRQRETNVVLLLSHEAQRFNNEDVKLRLDEPITGTAQFRLYQERTLKLSRAFESDFDQF
jgi:uncharacterized protein (TIGR02687 family)